MPWYLTAKVCLLKIWAWCKKYWQLIIGALIPIGMWLIAKLFFKKQAVEAVLENTNSAHRQELEVVEASHDIEMSGTRAAEEKHDRTVSQIKADHDAAQIKLSADKEVRIDEIVRQHGDNPDEITRRISEITGIKVMRRRQ